MVDYRRVVVTGMGAVTPIGNYGGSLKLGKYVRFLSSIKEGRNGISKLDEGFLDDFSFGFEDLGARVAGQILDFDPLRFGMDRKIVKRINRESQFGIAAVRNALGDASIEIGEGQDQILPEDVSLYVGTGGAGVGPALSQMKKSLLAEKFKRPSPFAVPSTMINSAAAEIGIFFGIRGDAKTCAASCASSGFSIIEAYKEISEGRTNEYTGRKDVMIAGGLESFVNSFSLLSFNSMRALSHTEEAIYRVYDEASDGFVMGEGAGFLVLEEFEHARARDARIYAEIIGFGTSNDADHISDPDMKGTQMVRCIKSALDFAGLEPREIDYISSHGTGTDKGDEIEHVIMKEVFGDYIKGIPVSSLKPMTGHMIGAGAAVELIGSILGMNYNFIPPTINLENPINGKNGLRLDHVANTARTRVYLANILKFTMGFGGHNAALVLKEPNWIR